ncbi:efflux RND transporter periplasmic adaptor subunit [Robertmurraya andreesenii]|uniref:HlyD family secretion protein n=1 Tax=Anoxybacillus andreesenii TaxID=1325932 RepID=A0ABT9V8T9_9BACL|nr:efflux RND transporter periplasmic adaptor subunit [Robertmurraya andreesenii]MDQ0157322.1 HlyD family secretion protein [Robertmurraya andreesenii]
MKKKIWIGIGVTALLLTMIGISVYRTAFSKPPTVKIIEAKLEEVSSLLMTPGTLELADEQSVFASPEIGEVEEILVEKGQQVKKGDILVKFKNPQLMLELEQNKLSIESGNLRINQLDKQKKALDDRKKELVKQIGKKEADKQMASEFEQLDMEKKLANIELKQTLLQKDALEKRVKELEVVSLIDGMVLSVHEPTQAPTDTAQPIVIVGSLKSLIATGLLSEYDVLNVKEGQRVILQSDALPDEKWEGEIIEVGTIPASSALSNTLENQAVQYPISVQLQSTNIPLKPGFQLIMEIETEKKKGIAVPIDAITYEQEKSYVFVVQDGVAHKQEVTIGISSGEKIEIVKGLKAGDKLIKNPSGKITDGMEVSTQ